MKILIGAIEEKDENVFMSVFFFVWNRVTLAVIDK